MISLRYCCHTSVSVRNILFGNSNYWKFKIQDNFYVTLENSGVEQLFLIFKSFFKYCLTFFKIIASSCFFPVQSFQQSKQYLPIAFVIEWAFLTYFYGHIICWLICFFSKLCNNCDVLYIKYLAVSKIQVTVPLQ